MSLFNSIQTGTNVAKPTDSLGGGDFTIPSGIYTATIDQAYVQKSQSSNALGIVFNFSVKSQAWDKPRKYSETLWVSNRNGQNYYVGKNGDQHFLPGFLKANDIISTLVGKGLTELTMEDTPARTVPVYNFKEQKEVPTNVNVIDGVMGRDVALCLVLKKVNKQAKNQTTGKYENTAEHRMVNEIDKVLFLKDGKPFTKIELTNGLAEPEFASKWLEKNKDEIRDQYKEVAQAQTSGSMGTSSTNQLHIV